MTSPQSRASRRGSSPASGSPSYTGPSRSLLLLVVLPFAACATCCATPLNQVILRCVWAIQPLTFQCYGQGILPLLASKTRNWGVSLSVRLTALLVLACQPVHPLARILICLPAAKTFFFFIVTGRSRCAPGVPYHARCP